VQLAADGPGDLGHPPLDGGVHVLVARLVGERAVGQLLADAVERGQDDLHLAVVEDPGPAQAAHVGPRPVEVVVSQSLVDGQAGREGQQLLRRALREPPAPESHGSRRYPAPPSASCRLTWRAAHVSTPSPQRRTNPSASSWRKRSAASYVA